MNLAGAILIGDACRDLYDVRLQQTGRGLARTADELEDIVQGVVALTKKLSSDPSAAGEEGIEAKIRQVIDRMGTLSLGVPEAESGESARRQSVGW